MYINCKVKMRMESMEYANRLIVNLDISELLVHNKLK